MRWESLSHDSIIKFIKVVDTFKKSTSMVEESGKDKGTSATALNAGWIQKEDREIETSNLR